MGINLNGSKLLAESGALRVRNSANALMLSYDSAGRLVKPMQTMFYARGSLNTWTTIGAGGQWYPVVYDTANVNIGSCYNTTNGRFTAPVTGLYLLTSNEYCYNPTAVEGYYNHPMYWINGASGGQNFAARAHFRIRGHGVAPGYAYDCDIAEIIYLNAGDYANVYNYVGGASSWFPAYSSFTACLLG